MNVAEREKLIDFCDEVQSLVSRIGACHLNEAATTVISIMGHASSVNDKAHKLRAEARMQGQGRTFQTE